MCSGVAVVAFAIRGRGTRMMAGELPVTSDHFVKLQGLDMKIGCASLGPERAAYSSSIK